jgi:histidyl-tRNA synthetase
MFNLPQPLKLYSIGPLFRAEKPQAGRYRQFHQLDIEVFGEQSSVIDAQVIQVCYAILEELKIKDVIVEVNSIGDNQCRPYYKKLLNSFLRRKQVGLCADCRRRIKTNSLRVLDCKQASCQKIVSRAPQIIDHLCQECHNHFKEVLEFLDELKLPYELNPCLVRGLDYYTKTVFEICEQKQGQDEKSLSLAGGGRFDRLVKLLGGKDTPVCGAAMGIERIINSLQQKNVKFSDPIKPKVFLAQLGSLAKRKSLKLLEDFRKGSITVTESFGRDSLTAQLNRANKLGVKYTLILGQKEALANEIIVRDMNTSRQKTVKIENVVKEMKKKK